MYRFIFEILNSIYGPYIIRKFYIFSSIFYKVKKPLNILIHQRNNFDNSKIKCFYFYFFMNFKLSFPIAHYLCTIRNKNKESDFKIKKVWKIRENLGDKSRKVERMRYYIWTAYFMYILCLNIKLSIKRITVFSQT